jgi:hypothetical protein
MFITKNTFLGLKTDVHNRPRNIRWFLIFLDATWPRNITILMSVQSYVYQDIFLSYVHQSVKEYNSWPLTYVPRFLADEHLSVSCSDMSHQHISSISCHIIVYDKK